MEPMNFIVTGYFLLGAHELTYLLCKKKNFNNYAKNIGTPVQNLVTWVTRQPEFVHLW
jgi:hypothetical protein